VSKTKRLAMHGLHKTDSQSMTSRASCTKF